MPQPRFIQLRGELRRVQLACTAHAKFAHGEHSQQYDEIGDQVLLQLVEPTKKHGPGIVRFAREKVDELAHRDHTRRVDRREYESAHGVRNDDTAAGPGIEAEDPLDPDNDGNQRQDDENAAQLPDERFPGSSLGVRPYSNQLVQTLPQTEQYKQCYE